MRKTIEGPYEVLITNHYLMKFHYFIMLLAWSFSIYGYGQDQIRAQDYPKPNVLLIVADDLGYSDIGAYGSEIATPILDKIAAQSVRFSNFHTMPTCAPTRSILLTGADNHLVGLGAQPGGFTNKQKGRPGYEGYLNARVATLPEVLQTAGYRTYMSGKWHLGHEDERAPHTRGFEETFALMPGGSSHFYDQMPLHPEEPVVYRRNGKVIQTLPQDFYSTKNYTDTLLSWIDRDKESKKPFFAYLAYTAPHDPLQAPQEYIDKYKGVYDEGYEVFRKRRFEGLKEKELISSDQEFPVWPKLIPRWSDVDQSEKQELLRDMETYAAMVDYLDEQIGRVYNWLETNDAMDNTIIIFTSDNGASGLDSKMFYPSYTDEYDSQFNNDLPNRGLINSFTNLDAGWAVASSALFRDFKGFTTEGGIRTPMFIKPIMETGKNVCSTFTHVADLMPTILEMSGVSHPSSNNSELVKMTGKSLIPLLKDPFLDIHKGEGIGFELHGTRAFIKDGWKILQSPMPLGNGQWELYNLNEDATEMNNLILADNDKFNEMLSGYESYESEVGVIYGLPGPLGIVSKLFNIIFWLLIAVFGLAIFGKLSGKLKYKYAKWGYGTIFMYVLAGVELLAVLGLFTIYYQYAAYVLVTIIIGAIFTLVRNKENWKSYLLPLPTSMLLGLYFLFKSGWLMTIFL